MSEGPAESTLESTSPARTDDAAATPEIEDGREPEVPLAPGARAGDFVIEGVIGRGSFGTVYRASHAVIGRRAAVKVLREHAAEGRAIESFIDEARMVARMRHPNIVDVLTFGRLDDGRHYQVMDLIDGPTLTDFMRESGAVDLATALPILRGIATALDTVHRAGVAHSDLKPANVVLERREGELVPKLIDFGVAKLIVPDAEHPPVARGPLVGTPRYMSPEQCRGHAADARADAYAFGLLTYEMLTGQPPFSGNDALELMLKHTSETPVAPSAIRASLPGAVDSIVLGLLEKQPERRPVELVPVVASLEGAAREGVSRAAHAKAAPRSRVWTARVALGFVIAAAVVLVITRGRGDAETTASDRAARTGPAAVSAAPVLEPAAPTTDVVARRGAEPETERSSLPAPSAPSSKTAPKSLRTERAAREKSSRPSRAPSPAAEPAAESPSGPGLEDPENPFGGH